MLIHKDTNGEVTTAIEATNDWVYFTVSDTIAEDTLTLTRDEAIAAARAILAHYKEPV